MGRIKNPSALYRYKGEVSNMENLKVSEKAYKSDKNYLYKWLGKK